MDKKKVNFALKIINAIIMLFIRKQAEKKQ